METRSRVFQCAWCLRRVCICVHCDDGQAYCCKQCSQLGRRRSLKRAGITYQKTKRGKFKHADRQRRYLVRQKELKKVTHHPCTEETICDKPSMKNVPKIQTDESLVGSLYRNTTRETLNHTDRQEYYLSSQKVTHHPYASQTFCDALSINNEHEINKDGNREAICCVCTEIISLQIEDCHGKDRHQKNT